MSHHLTKISLFRFQIIVLLLLSLLLSSCFWQFDPYGGLYVTQEPASEDVVGVYKLREQTLTSGGLDDVGDIGTTITINADGTYAITNFPLWQGLVDYEFDELLSDEGLWEISIIGGNSYESFWGIRFSNNQIPPAGLIDDGASLGLIFTYGDPDAGDVMIFEKVNTN